MKSILASRSIQGDGGRVGQPAKAMTAEAQARQVLNSAVEAWFT